MTIHPSRGRVRWVALVAMVLVAGGAAASAFADEPAQVESVVAVRGRPVFTLHGADRARAVSKILTDFVEREAAPPVTLLPQVDGQLIHLGDKDLVRLTPIDAAWRGLDPQVYYESVRSDVERFLLREQRRARLQQGVLSVSMAVFLGLMALLVLRWLGRRSEDVRAFIEERARRSRGLLIRELEVLSPQALESTLLALTGIAVFIARVGVVYGYLVYALSRFEFTRNWVPVLSHAVTAPFVTLFERLGAALPAAVLVVVGIYLLRGGLRIVRVFLDHVSRGELRSGWLKADLAAPARPLASVLLVLLALLALGPMVSGASDSMLSRLGLVGLGTIALGAVPALASIVLGTAAIYSRRYTLGQWVQLGAHVGEVTEVGFLDLCLVPLGAGQIRVPHLMTLFVTVRFLPSAPPVELDLPLSSSAPPERVITVIGDALSSLGKVTVRLVSIDRDAAWYRVALADAHPDSRSDALSRALKALAAAEIPLGVAGAQTRAQE